MDTLSYCWLITCRPVLTQHIFSYQLIKMSQMTRCKKAAALTNQLISLLVRVQFRLEEAVVTRSFWHGNAATAAAVPQVRLKAHVHLQQLINSLPLGVPLLHTHTHTTGGSIIFQKAQHTQIFLKDAHPTRSTFIGTSTQTHYRIRHT